MLARNEKLNSRDVLARYIEEDLPEFSGFEGLEINQAGMFGNAPLHVACVRGSVDEVEALIDGGADLNIKGENGNTPLHEAAIQGHLDVVKVLIQNGARKDIVNDDGKSAFDVATIGGKNAVSEYLL